MVELKNISFKNISFSNISALLGYAKENRKLCISLLSIIGLIVVDIFFIVLPLLNKSSDLKRQIVAIKRNVEVFNQEVSTVDTTKKRLGDLKVEQAEYEKRFPKEEEITSLLNSLANIASKSGVDIIAIKPIKSDIKIKDESQRPVQIFHEIPLELSAKGGYHQIGQFINKIETLNRFMNVKDVEIKQDNATPRGHQLRLEVTTYILKE